MKSRFPEKRREEKINRKAKMKVKGINGEKRQAVIYKIADAANKSKNLEQLFKCIHRELGKVIEIVNFYIALYEEQRQLITFPYYVDETLPLKSPISRDSRKFGKGLTEYVIKKGKATLLYGDDMEELHRRGRIDLIGSPSLVWLGVPLMTKGRTIGVIAVQDYRNSEAYGREDMQFLEFVSGQIATVIERRRAEEDLRASEEKYRTILENIEDGYFEVDIAGNLTFFNDSLRRLLGYPRDELMGMNNRQFTDEENAKKLYQAFNKVFRTGIPTKGFDWEIIRKDGTKRFIEASASLIKDASNQPVGFRGIVRDVTERKCAEMELERSKEQLEFYNDLMSHDLTNINQITLGYLELLGDTQLTERQREYVNKILYSTKNNARLIENVKKIWQAHETKTRPTDLGRCIEDAIREILVPSAKSVKINYEPKKLYVHANDLLKNVIRNLLDNAVKFDPSQNVCVDILVSEKEEKVKISVADRGRGIPDEYKRIIFTRAEKLEKDMRGSGFGLNLVKVIMESYGGQVWAEDNKPQGSIFNLVLSKARR